jgi:AraC-like DNA-binding protein
MDDFFKYLTPGPEDMEWGLYLLCAGKAHIQANTVYPPGEHPSGYYFTWENGRVLNEYQINYITEGNGIYENKKGQYRISPGSLLITRPGHWHRYRPEHDTGWVEHYVGFRGNIASHIFRQPWFAAGKAVVDIGNREEFIDTYYKIFEYIQEEKPGSQQVAAGMIMKLLGYMISHDKQKDFSGKRVEQIIQNACFMIRKNVEQQIDFRDFAEQNHIGYSYFRKMFKKYTGVPPVQYHLDLKIMRAKEMLLSTDKIIKEISYELGFQSIYYFSRVFKKKIGVSPSEIRKTLNGSTNIKQNSKIE